MSWPAQGPSELSTKRPVSGSGIGGWFYRGQHKARRPALVSRALLSAETDACLASNYQISVVRRRVKFREAVPEVGFEPTRLSACACETHASTRSAIRARTRKRRN